MTKYLISFLTEDLNPFQKLEVKAKYQAIKIAGEISEDETKRIGAAQALALLKPEKLMKYLSLDQYK